MATNPARQDHRPSSGTRLAERVAVLKPSDIRLIGQVITERRLEPLRLDIGVPDLPTPGHVLEAAAAAGTLPSAYTAAQGLPVFRQAAARYLAERHELEVSPDDVVAVAGATGGLMSAFLLLTDPGDEVLIPTPGFPSYGTQLPMAGAIGVPYVLRPELGDAPDLDEVEALVTDRTRAIVINSPGNPTGAVLPAAVLERIAAFAEAHDLAVISDEVYADLVFDGKTASALAADRQRTFGLFSLSKSFSMPGWRIGFAVTPPGLAARLAVVNAQLAANHSSVAQAAAAAALGGPLDHLDWARGIYQQRRDLAVATLRQLGVACSEPGGSFYLTVPLPAGTDSLALCLDLLNRGIAVVPGTAFGEPTGPFLRICLTAPGPALEKGLRLLASELPS